MESTILEGKKPCGCGCGTLIDAFDKCHHRPRNYAKNHFRNTGMRFPHPGIRDRICSRCGTGKTYLDKRGNPIWRHNGEEILCTKCFEKLRNVRDSERQKRRWLDYYYRNKEERIEYRKKYYGINKERLIRKRVQRYRDHKLEENAVVRQSRRRGTSMSKKRRIEIVISLGGKCVCCGYSADLRALCLDHIEGFGWKDRKRFPSVHHYYLYYLANPEEARKRLQVLCANCNVIKMTENREYRSGYVTPVVTSIET